MNKSTSFLKSVSIYLSNISPLENLRFDSNSILFTSLVFPHPNLCTHNSSLDLTRKAWPTSQPLPSPIRMPKPAKKQPKKALKPYHKDKTLPLSDTSEDDDIIAAPSNPIKEEANVDPPLPSTHRSGVIRRTTERRPHLQEEDFLSRQQQLQRERPLQTFSLKTHKDGLPRLKMILPLSVGKTGLHQTRPHRMDLQTFTSEARIAHVNYAPKTTTSENSVSMKPTADAQTASNRHRRRSKSQSKMTG